MQFTRLRLSGFKSFVDPTELVIEKGLTGVVGPNGCGKSNLLEALRWVMGETSPKSMRGTGMEDVIFAGTDSRNARHFAEVTLTIDNGARRAPAAFNEFELLEISRRIQREAGSTYRVNGKETRARDVQILFADTGTGANSPALVRQGQIGQLINAKPKARRLILEEAAGIAGLHSRRHEAELRLRAAEQNLTRLEDVIGTLETQRNTLKRQARQATRYKEMAARIRQAEALLLHLRHVEALKGLEAAQADVRAADRAVAEAMTAAQAAAREEETARDALPPLREEQAVARAVLQRLTIAREQLGAEAQALEDRIEGLVQRVADLDRDLARERARIEDADRALAELAEEGEPNPEPDPEELALEAAAEAELQTRAGEVRAAEQAVEELRRTLTDLKARNAALDAEARAAEARLARAEAEVARAAEALSRAEADGGSATALDAARAALADTASARDAARDAADAADRDRTEKQRQEAELRDAVQEADRELGRLKAEARALRPLVATPAADGTPALDTLKVEAGYEIALAAALGDDLDAPIDREAARSWRTLAANELPPLPAGLDCLADHVTAPPALARRLRLIAVADDGAAQQEKLLPGQRIVSRSGALWRWDGFTVRADAPSPAAVRLEQRNRLAALDAEIAPLEPRAQAAKEAHHAARDAARAAAEADTQARAALRRAEEAVTAAQGRLSRIETEAGVQAARLEQARTAHAQAQAERDAARAAAAEAAEACAGTLSLVPLEAEIARARDTLDTARTSHDSARERRDGLRRAREDKAQRAERLARDLAAWTARRTQASDQLGEIERRHARAAEELAGQRALPNDIETRRATLERDIAVAERRRHAADEALATAETALAEASRKARAAEQALAETREGRAAAGARAEAANARLADSADRIREALGCTPERLAEVADLDVPEALPAIAATEGELERLKRDRDALGAVNLRADDELQEIASQFDALVSERDDLVAAIHRLRQGIAALNREGRERLLAAFDTVNAHFEQLFTRLFRGGSAKLELIESDDPLEAGLEIMAQPPGKKTRALSLLSGGEQALTAMALIFAVFLTNPSPICVLDEVDAPLDDANVERYCALLEEMTKLTDTRFLVITHHALTMSRMDRLFGVTMAEKGVSQLVSVDLARAERLTAA
ncbi:chromosome segregation protein SMC [Futiania mangrovi]|uniref:Chromosome partition protein Smc n=1 Tax=Futiania mangrovi TaxID=2959716 RepID=A0A9J6PFU2_9PROT|nr:chromosome segregation protein SMC [Futiania mangrovii]MCP1337585.1 chromosome segregation protein SMC [Futiania mangrovii]